MIWYVEQGPKRETRSRRSEAIQLAREWAQKSRTEVHIAVDWREDGERFAANRAMAEVRGEDFYY